jgi:2-keto-4-pentenoate hydratase/2-oxohepta-3-ene-1,7-dioic acid hydratase in catechol pathway
VKPPGSDAFDFEGELALVIGTAGRHISRERALEHVAGWTPFMDGSVRDWQRHTAQFTPGKNFDASGSIGPKLVAAAEFGDYRAHTLTTCVNGAVVQHTDIALMLFDAETLITYISGFTELRPGDIIATGTCGGVGEKRVPPLYLFPGDTVEVEISGIPVLRNPVVAER